MASFDDDGNAQLSQLALFLSGAGQRAKLQQAKTAEMAQQVAPKAQAPAPVSAASPTLVAGGAGPSRIASELTNQVAQNRFNADGATPDLSSGMTPGGAPKPVASPIPETPESVLHDVPATARRNGLQSQLSTPAPTLADKKLRPGWGGAALAGLATFGASLNHNPNAMQIGQDLGYQKYNRARADWDTNQAQTRAQLQEFDKGEEVYDRGQRRQQEMQDIALRKSTLDRQLHNDTLAEENRRRDDDRANKVLSAKEKADAERERANRAREDNADRRTSAIEEKLAQGPASPQFSASERLKLRTKARELGKKSVDDLSSTEINDALGGGKGRGFVSTFRDKEAVTAYSDKWYTTHKKELNASEQATIDKYKALADGGSLNDEQKAARAAELGAHYKAYKDIAEQHEKNKAEWYAKVSGGTPVTIETDEEGKEVTQAPAAPSKGDSPSAKPATSQGGGKVATKADIERFAKAKGISYAEAEKIAKRATKFKVQ